MHKISIDSIIIVTKIRQRLCPYLLPFCIIYYYTICHLLAKPYKLKTQQKLPYLYLYIRVIMTSHRSLNDKQ